MVRNAPPIKAVIQELADFIGDSPVVGHNVQFDLGFLHKNGILGLAEPIDTYELAAVLMPTASRYNLGSLGQILGILIPNSHRAMDDARLAHAVYMQLYERAIHMPLELLAEIVRDAKHWIGMPAGSSARLCAPGTPANRSQACCSRQDYGALVRHIRNGFGAAADLSRDAYPAQCG